MKTIHVETASRPYDVTIGRELLNSLGTLLSGLIKGRKAALFSDSNVIGLYGERAAASLENSGFYVTRLVFPAGEASKTLQTLTPFYSRLASEGFTRDDAVVALGGGVTGDMAGLLAGTYQRGIAVMQVPTTLLACVDSSVGGKTAVDLPEGKNLVGVFHQPLAVLVDPALLDTLSPVLWSDGMAEVIKSACIADGEFCELLRKGKSIPREEIISRCVTIKRDIVQKDERDTGIRNILNFGHTIGHAYEKLYGFEGVSHGRAVAAGMVAAAKIGAELGITPLTLPDELAGIITANNLPLKLEGSPRELFSAALNDKKRRSGDINLILLENWGRAVQRKMDVNSLEDLLVKIAG